MSDLSFKIVIINKQIITVFIIVKINVSNELKSLLSISHKINCCEQDLLVVQNQIKDQINVYLNQSILKNVVIISISLWLFHLNLNLVVIIINVHNINVLYFVNLKCWVLNAWDKVAWFCNLSHYKECLKCYSYLKDDWRFDLIE